MKVEETYEKFNAEWIRALHILDLDVLDIYRYIVQRYSGQKILGVGLLMK